MEERDSVGHLGPFQNSSSSGVKFTSSVIPHMASEGKLNKILCVCVKHFASSHNSIQDDEKEFFFFFFSSQGPEF